jgi:hypothetical protein
VRFITEDGTEKSPEPMPKWRAKTPSLWKETTKEDEEGFDYVFQSRSSCTLRRTTPDNFPAPNPAFQYKNNDAQDSKELFSSLVLEDHLSLDVRNRVISFVQEFWDCFRAEGVKIPVLKQHESVLLIKLLYVTCLYKKVRAFYCFWILL